MANLTLVVPDNAVNRIAEAFGYQTEVPEVDGTSVKNPQTRAAFMKQQLTQHIKNTVVTYESQKAIGTATKDIGTSVEAINIT